MILQRFSIFSGTKNPYGFLDPQHFIHPMDPLTFPEGSAVTAVSKLAGAEWKALSEAKKKPYEENSQAVLIGPGL